MNHDNVVQWERALLGCLIVEPELIDQFSEITGDSFYDVSLGALLDLMRTNHAVNRPNTVTSLRIDSRMIFQDKSSAEIAELFTAITEIPNVNEVRYYAEKITQSAQLRSLEILASEIRIELESNIEPEPDHIIGLVNARLDEMRTTQIAETISLHESCVNLIEKIESPEEEATNPVMTGLTEIDHTFGGFMPGELVVIAARPGSGKTVLAMQVAIHEARVNDRKTLMVSMEMSDSELTSRIACGHADVDGRKLRHGTMTDDEKHRMLQSVKEIASMKITMNKTGRINVQMIKSMARSHQARHGLDLLIVDYIGLIIPRDRKANRTEQISEMTAELKSLARELGVPILALSQLNREADKGEPRLSHLRESGAIEQDADIVIFLHRQNPTNPGDMTTSFIIGKHRHGTIGKKDVILNGKRSYFETPGQPQFEELHQDAF